MVKNMGNADRVVRIVLAVFIAFALVMQYFEGTAAILFALVAAYLVFTGLAGSCPLYKAIDVDSHPDHDHDDKLAL